MKKLIVLHNVYDTRTDQFHSVVICDERKARYFIQKTEQ